MSLTHATIDAHDVRVLIHLRRWQSLDQLKVKNVKQFINASVNALPLQEEEVAKDAQNPVLCRNVSIISRTPAIASAAALVWALYQHGE